MALVSRRVSTPLARRRPADALTSVLTAMDADQDGSLSGSEMTRYLDQASSDTANASSDNSSATLAESIVKAMANQSQNATDQDQLAQQYTTLLQALKG